MATNEIVYIETLVTGSIFIPGSRLSEQTVIVVIVQTPTTFDTPSQIKYRDVSFRYRKVKIWLVKFFLGLSRLVKVRNTLPLERHEPLQSYIPH